MWPSCAGGDRCQLAVELLPPSWNRRALKADVTVLGLSRPWFSLLVVGLEEPPEEVSQPNPP